MRKTLFAILAALIVLGVCAYVFGPYLAMPSEVREHVSKLKDENPYVRRDAALSLGLMRTQAQAAVPVLIKALNDEDHLVSGAASDALGRIGPLAVPGLIRALENAEDDAKWRAADALGDIGPGAAEAAPALIESMRRPHTRNVGISCADALARIGAPVVPALVRILGENDPDMRATSCRILGEIGPPARDALPLLLKELQDPHSLARANAARALGKCSAPPEIVVPKLVLALKDSDSVVRALAAGALGDIGAPGKQAVPALAETLLTDDAVDVAEMAADSLGRIGPDAASAAPALIRAIKSGRASGISALALGEIGAVTSETIPLLVAALYDEDWGLRSSAVTALGKIARRAPDESLPHLIKVLRDASLSVQGETAAVLGDLGPIAKPAVPALIELLKDENNRFGAAQALFKIDPEAAERAGADKVSF